MSMRAVKKTISIPEDLCKHVARVSDNFSATVTMALMEYLHHLKIQKAQASFGQWKERSETSATLVNQLRQERTRHYVDRSH